MRRTSTVGLLIVLFVLLLSLAASVTPSYAQTNVTVVVRRGDFLIGIANRYCTTWQEIYNLNRAAIGANPNRVLIGTRLTFPNRCGNRPPTTGVFDRGVRPHARGGVAGNVYTVAVNDTLYSIGLRFGLTPHRIASFNGLWNVNWVYAGQRLVIPGL
jgi:LysM repeat protein